MPEPERIVQESIDASNADDAVYFLTDEEAARAEFRGGEA